MRSFVLVMASLSVACAGTDGRADQGRGSEACRIWQDAACDHFADECDAIERATCDQQYQSVTCRTDSVAESCTKQLEAASCGEATVSCLIDGVADVEPAIEACETLLDKFCERATECGFTDTQEDCRMGSARDLECSKAVGYGLEFEQCIDKIAEISCEVLLLPAICQEVILRSS